MPTTYTIKELLEELDYATKETPTYIKIEGTLSEDPDIFFSYGKIQDNSTETQINLRINQGLEKYIRDDIAETIHQAATEELRVELEGNYYLENDIPVIEIKTIEIPTQQPADFNKNLGLGPIIRRYN